jgi:hypothetical protein
VIRRGTHHCFHFSFTLPQTLFLRSRRYACTGLYIWISAFVIYVYSQCFCADATRSSYTLSFGIGRLTEDRGSRLCSSFFFLRGGAVRVIVLTFASRSENSVVSYTVLRSKGLRGSSPSARGVILKSVSIESRVREEDKKGE